MTKQTTKLIRDKEKGKKSLNKIATTIICVKKIKTINTAQRQHLLFFFSRDNTKIWMPLRHASVGQ